MSTLERAIAIAAQAHAGQLDKGGAPYVLHPLRVMQKQTCEEARIVGALHDVIERGGSDWTLTRLAQEGFAAVVLGALDAVSRRGGENEMKAALRAAAWAHQVSPRSGTILRCLEAQPRSPRRRKGQRPKKPKDVDHS